MTTLFAERALLPHGWMNDVRVTLGPLGRIASVETEARAAPEDLRLAGWALLPAPSNLHSHSFQRAIAGMTERRQKGRDSFWTWRVLMYRFLDVLTPEQIEAIAALTFLEMLEAGFAAVAEFHYVHHRPGGGAYDAPAELSHRIFAAAAETGIGLTHLPVLYTYGGAGRKPLAGGQLRFGCDLDRFSALVEAARPGVAALPDDCRMGTAPHSLRATAPDELAECAARYPTGPFHMHAAEQVQEVEDVVAWLGARPVEYLLAEHGADARWCLIHCTQMTPAETESLAAAGVVAGLCPLTEGNLGDGIFDGARFLEAGGLFGIGSDSNTRVALAGELCQLEYSQRLRDRARNVMAAEGRSTGETLYRTALAGGARALGRETGAIEEGCYADLVAIDLGDVAFPGLEADQVIDGWVFSAGDRVVTDVWSAGRHIVRDGRHVAREAVEARYRRVLADLVATI